MRRKERGEVCPIERNTRGTISRQVQASSAIARAPAGKIEPCSSRAAHWWWCHGFCPQNNARITWGGGPSLGYFLYPCQLDPTTSSRGTGSGPLHRQRVWSETCRVDLEPRRELLLACYHIRVSLFHLPQPRLGLPPNCSLLTRYVADAATVAGARWALPVSNDPCSIAASIILFPLIIEVVQMTMFLRPTDGFQLAHVDSPQPRRWTYLLPASR